MGKLVRFAGIAHGVWRRQGGSSERRVGTHFSLGGYGILYAFSSFTLLMYYDSLFLVLFVEGRMHGLHWGRRDFLVVGLIAHLIGCGWGSGRVDTELIALAA